MHLCLSAEARVDMPHELLTDHLRSWLAIEEPKG